MSKNVKLPTERVSPAVKTLRQSVIEAGGGRLENHDDKPLRASEAKGRQSPCVHHHRPSAEESGRHGHEVLTEHSQPSRSITALSSH
jgi:hypothetical protein